MNHRLFAVTLFLIGCGNAGPAEVGSEGHACYPNNTCDVGLTCSASRCVGSDAGTESSCRSGEVCTLHAPPASSSSASDAVSVTYALRDVTLNQTDPNAGALTQPWRFIGTDLDGIRTDVAGGANGCLVPTNPDGGGPSIAFPIDGNAGVDNQFGAQLSGTLFPLVAPNLQPTACCKQRFGRGTLLVHIQNWNGMPDDAHVSIGITTTFDGSSDDPAGLSYDSAADREGYVVSGGSRVRAAAPAWTPDTDTWYANASDVIGSDIERPRHLDVNGYATSGYFVMHLDVTRALKFFLGAQESLMVGLQDGTMVLHLSPNGHLIDDGWIAGRMDTSSLEYLSDTLQASTLYSSANGGDNTIQCAATTSLATTFVHEFGDVLASGATQASTPCDAISVGLRFHGVRAKDVRVAPTSLAFASPDCGGAPAVIGTLVPEEATCGSVRDTSPGTCGIRPWSSAD